MHYIIKDTRIYALLGMIVLLAGFILCLHINEERIRHALLQEKIAGVGNDLQYISSTIDYLVERDGGWDVEKHQDTLAFLVQQIDATPNIYAELLGSRYQTISTRIIPADDSWQFYIRSYPDLMNRIRSEDSGNHKVVCYPKNSPVSVYVYWCRVPTDAHIENRLTLLVGVSHYSVNIGVAGWLGYSIIALFAVAVIGIIYGLIKFRNREANKANT